MLEMRHFRSWILSFRGIISILALIGLTLFPLVIRNSYWSYIMILAMIFAIYAGSWDLLAGITGQVCFGHAAFFGIAGWATAALLEFSGVHWFISLFIGACTAAGTALLVGFPTLRLKGPYFALGTLAFSLILWRAFKLLFGESGITGLPDAFPDIIAFFFIVLVILLISFVFLHVTAKSNVGIILKSIRDDEVCAEASGINLTKYKLIAIMISGFFAGIAGGLFILDQRAVNYYSFQSLYSFYPLIMVAIGGITTISGAIIGAFIFQIFQVIFADLGEINLLIFAVILILFIRFAPRGILDPIMNGLKRLWDWIRRK